MSGEDLSNLGKSTISLLQSAIPEVSEPYLLDVHRVYHSI